ncbi:MAG: hypothetical protein LBD58_05175 [Treponema sp.]|nr:hypothetical protein [Treponema sp.]
MVWRRLKSRLCLEAARQKRLAIEYAHAAKAPAYVEFRVEDRFDSAKKFAAYLIWRRPPQYPGAEFLKRMPPCAGF